MNIYFCYHTRQLQIVFSLVGLCLILITADFTKGDEGVRDCYVAKPANKHLTARTGVTMICSNTEDYAVTPTQTNNDMFGSFERYPPQENAWIRLVNDTLYFTDRAFRAFTYIDNEPGKTWTASALKPDGTTVEWGTLLYDYDGCFYYDGQLVHCWGCPPPCIWYWWYEDDCLTTGKWNMTFYRECVTPCSDPVYGTGEFTILPEAPPDSIPLVEQCKEIDSNTGHWGREIYDHWCFDPCYPPFEFLCGSLAFPIQEQRFTICEKGCALSAFTMILNYHGVTVDPGRLNDWLSTNGGYDVGGGVIPQAVSAYAKIVHGVELKYCGEQTEGDEARLSELICKYGPQIIGHIGSEGTPNSHWLVVYGIDEQQQTFLIRDPAAPNLTTLKDVIATSGLCNGKPFCRLLWFIGPNSSVTSGCSQGPQFIFGLGSPGELLVTDPQGRRTGMDPVGGVSYDEIPWSSYSEYGLDSHGGVPSSHLIKNLEIRYAAAGRYELVVTGTGEGTYNLHIAGYSTDLESAHTYFNDVPTSPGKIHTFHIDYNDISGSATVAESDCHHSCGDFNGDLRVGIEDLDFLAQCWLSMSQAKGCFCYDLNNGGRIDLYDYTEFATRYGQSAPTNEVAGLTCDNGIDDDCDGLTDCDDPDCADDPACRYCGNGRCDTGEDCESCPDDCAGITSGPPSQRHCCGNGVLEPPEGDGTICDSNP